MVRNLPALAGFILVSLLAGAVGSVFTVPSIPSWYAFLDKPWFNPPDWVFGPVWTALYVLMGVAAYLAFCRMGEKPGETRYALEVFGLQLALNAGWSVAFFGCRSILGGLLIIVLLWLAIAWTISLFWKLDRNASYLMLPYILWVSFAAVLNAALLALNVPVVQFAF